MQFLMIGIGENHKILYPVIQWIIIYMMHMFIACQFAA